LLKALSCWGTQDGQKGPLSPTTQQPRLRIPESRATGPLPHTLEPTLRKHGVPSKLNKGIVEVLSDYKVCIAGERLSAHQVRQRHRN